MRNPLIYITDPILEMSLDDVKNAVSEAEAFRAKEREAYGGHQAVMVVDHVRDLEKLKPMKVGIPKAKKFKDAVCAVGYVKVGAFRRGDAVSVLHGGDACDAEVLFATRDTGLNDDKFGNGEIRAKFAEIQVSNVDMPDDVVGEGEQVLLILNSNAQGKVSVGDQIVIR